MNAEVFGVVLLAAIALGQVIIPSMDKGNSSEQEQVSSLPAARNDTSKELRLECRRKCASSEFNDCRAWCTAYDCYDYGFDDKCECYCEMRGTNMYCPMRTVVSPWAEDDGVVSCTGLLTEKYCYEGPLCKYNSNAYQ